MKVRSFCLVAAALGALLGGSPSWAADPQSQQQPIAGQDAMGDKSRSGPDGWAWAPVTRDRAASGQAPGQSQAGSAPNARPPAQSAQRLPAGDDPGAPAGPQSSGPGTLDRSAAARKP